MAWLPVIEFESWLDRTGYRLEEATPWVPARLRSPKKAQMLPRPERVVRNGRNEDRPVVIRPLDKNDMLFLIFIKTATTADGVLKFVQQFGPLTHAGHDADNGEIVDDIIRRARRMAELFRSLDDRGRLRPPVPQVSGDAIEVFPSASVNASLVWNRRARAIQWQFRPSTLLDALWLQFGQATARGAHIRACRQCGTWFEAGGGGRRSDATFCCDDHRIRFNSLERSRKEN